jgi:hypothetical protein
MSIVKPPHKGLISLDHQSCHSVRCEIVCRLTTAVDILAQAPSFPLSGVQVLLPMCLSVSDQEEVSRLSIPDEILPV